MSSTDGQTSGRGVPSPGDPDRKRVLNVLAQRRYRQRRRERIAALEAQAASIPTTEHPEDSTIFPTPAITPDDSNTIPSNSSTGDTLELDSGFQSSLIVELPDCTDNMPPTTTSDFSFTFDQPAFDIPMPTFTDLDLCFPSSITPPISLSSRTGSPLPAFSFPLAPDANLSIPVLSTLRGCLTIASLLSVQHTLYDLSYSHTLAPNPNPHLPANLRPTPAQLTIPHHPVLDILPWPSVRSKLIVMLAAGGGAASFLPPSTGGGAEGAGLAIMQLVSDMDDLAEGCRVSGANELVEEAWEVGEAMLRNWWWAFDREIVERSNRLRAARGVGRLRVGG